jgi:hypothetical protein
VTIVYPLPFKGDLLFAKFLIIEIKINKSFSVGLPPKFELRLTVAEQSAAMRALFFFFKFHFQH